MRITPPVPLAAGQLLILNSEDAGRVVTVKNGSGNIVLAGSDFVMDSPDDRLMLIYDGTNWVELSRSDNG